MASTQNPHERRHTTAARRTAPAPVAFKLTKHATVKPSAVISEAVTTPSARRADSIHPQASHKSDTQFAGAVNEDALKMRRLQEGQSMYAVPVYKRALWLASDAVVLTIASPCFAVWWIARAIKRITEPK